MINLIVAMDINNLIGSGDNLPWHYPEDLRYFKETTLNKAVLMGKTTFNNIIKRLGKPLPNRNNIVITHDLTFSYPRVNVIHDLDSFLTSNKEDLFVIGGRQIYEQTLPYANRLYITYINKIYQGDVYFPTFDLSKYQLISKKEDQELSFCVYQRMD